MSRAAAPYGRGNLPARTVARLLPPERGVAVYVVVGVVCLAVGMLLGQHLQTEAGWRQVRRLLVGSHQGRHRS